MADFPVIRKPSSIDEDWEDIGISSQMEDGAEVSRTRFTRSRGTWVLHWNHLSDTDYDQLMDFFKETVKGKAQKFNWTHPVSDEVYAVRFAQKDKFTRDTTHWSGSVTLREA
jgi:hypothetical protein